LGGGSPGYAPSFPTQSISVINSNTTGISVSVGNNTGGGGSHTHSFSGSGSATFSGNAINLAVKYVDVIRATKD
jgi:hypothetical protein